MNSSFTKQLANEGKPKVIARMTVTRALGNLTIVEVREDATFSTFYQVFTQTGRRRSTKRLVRTANRNEGLQPHFRAYRMQPGLEKLAEHWQKLPGVTSVKVRIIKKRLYRKLISARPDELGLAKSSVSLPVARFATRGIPVQFNYTNREAGSVLTGGNG